MAPDAGPTWEAPFLCPLDVSALSNEPLSEAWCRPPGVGDGGCSCPGISGSWPPALKVLGWLSVSARVHLSGLWGSILGDCDTSLEKKNWREPTFPCPCRALLPPGKLCVSHHLSEPAVRPQVRSAHLDTGHHPYACTTASRNLGRVAQY